VLERSQLYQGHYRAQAALPGRTRRQLAAQNVLDAAQVERAHPLALLRRQLAMIVNLDSILRTPRRPAKAAPQAVIVQRWQARFVRAVQRDRTLLPLGQLFVRPAQQENVPKQLELRCHRIVILAWPANTPFRLDPRAARFVRQEERQA
jgi:hypothetical protein